MAKATCVYITPHTNTSAVCLLEHLKAAGMRLQAQGRTYAILWRHQCVVRDLTLLQAAVFIDRALVR